jgi:hypothetical protein
MVAGGRALYDLHPAAEKLTNRRTEKLRPMAVPAAAKAACGRFCGWFAVASPKMPADNGRVDESLHLVAFPCASVWPGESKRMLPIAQSGIQVEWSLRDVFHASPGACIGLIVAVPAFAVFVYYARSWFFSDDDPAENANQTLSEIREMYEEGKLSDEEFRSIKGRLMHQQKSTPAGDE